uniref:Uncharacterized protein n=1 Tax=Amphimedon queenslandica TaxID=400682 RepID=A0A1X7UKX8_AMPQE
MKRYSQKYKPGVQAKPVLISTLYTRIESIGNVAWYWIMSVQGGSRDRSHDLISTATPCVNGWECSWHPLQ